MANAKPVTASETDTAPEEATVKESTNSSVKAPVRKPVKGKTAVKKSKSKTTHGNKRIDS